MFIYSFKASSIKFFGILCVAMAALITLIAFVPAYAGDGTPAQNGRSRSRRRRRKRSPRDRCRPIRRRLNSVNQMRRRGRCRCRRT